MVEAASELGQCHLGLWMDEVAAEAEAVGVGGLWGDILSRSL